MDTCAYPVVYVVYGCRISGVRPVDFLGNFYMSNTTDVEIAAISSNKAFSVEVKHDDKLEESDGVYIQVSQLLSVCQLIKAIS